VNLGGSGCTTKKRCSVCQGDCDRDADCMKGLKCFQRGNYELIKGCQVGGSGDRKGYDYCYDGKALHNYGGTGCTKAKKCEKCGGDCDSDADCKTGLKCFQRNGFTKVPDCNAHGTVHDVSNYDFCYNDPKGLKSMGGSGCTRSKRCSACHGDCDGDYDCKPGLKCFQRNALQQIHGCGFGGSNDVRGYDYCYNPKALFNLGGSGCTPSKKCARCQGDCDSDRDCKDGLKCYQRNGKTPIPGCDRGGIHDYHNYDFCYTLGYTGQLVNKGGSGCTPKKQCLKCQGDCDSDRDCKGQLRCFQRRDNTVVQGCRAGGKGDVRGYDFCYDEKVLHNYGGTGCTPKKPCDKCGGDCDRDSDCKGALQCFQRNGLAKVPSCKAGGYGDVLNYDFCMDWGHKGLQNLGGSGCRRTKKCAMCQGDCDNDAECRPGLQCFQRNGYTAVHGCGIGGAGDKNNYDYCYDPRILHHYGGSGCTPSKKCARCQGDCDSDRDCKPGLKCFQRNNKKVVTGCKKGGRGDIHAHDFCYADYPALVNLGGSGCTTKKPCTRCQGDCDTDNDCKGPLRCFQRNDNRQVHSCAVGGLSDIRGYDYCFIETHLHNFGASGCTNKKPCGKCHGDCDNDKDCQGALQCFQRNGLQYVPGCSKGGQSGYDFCYDGGHKKLQNLGGSGCTKAKPCAMCQGDCDSDSDCRGALECFQRSGYTAIHGCGIGGAGDTNNYDYCYDPKKLHNWGGSGCTPSKKCDTCQGDCDSDRDCKTGLKCFQRSNKKVVTGCKKGGVGDKNAHDYCFNPVTKKRCAGDISGPGKMAPDGKVNVEDLLSVLANFGCSARPGGNTACNKADVAKGSSANKVDVEDILAVLANYGRCN